MPTFSGSVPDDIYFEVVPDPDLVMRASETIWGVDLRSVRVVNSSEDWTRAVHDPEVLVLWSFREDLPNPDEEFPVWAEVTLPVSDDPRRLALQLEHLARALQCAFLTKLGAPSPSESLRMYMPTGVSRGVFLELPDMPGDPERLSPLDRAILERNRRID